MQVQNMEDEMGIIIGSHPGEREQDWQVTFEAMLGQYQAQEVPEGIAVDSEPFMVPEVGEVREQLFVSPGSRPDGLPRVGASLITDKGQAEYAARFYEGNPPAHGPVTVGELHFQIRGQGRGASGPPGFFGPYVNDLADRFDKPIIQAVANAYGERVLHSRSVNVSDRTRRAVLELEGYQPRAGYPECYDRFYEPELSEQDQAG
jgi:hypothetical protein